MNEGKYVGAEALIQGSHGLARAGRRGVRPVAAAARKAQKADLQLPKRCSAAWRDASQAVAGSELVTEFETRRPVIASWRQLIRPAPPKSVLSDPLPPPSRPGERKRSEKRSFCDENGWRPGYTNTLPRAFGLLGP
jgi:hypothetical protein